MQRNEDHCRPWRCSLHPDRAVEAAVLQRLEEVVLADTLGLRQVRDGAGDLKDAVMGPRTEVQIMH